jgi:hypothetical protein
MNDFLLFITIDAYQAGFIYAIVGCSLIHASITMESNLAIPLNIMYVFVVIPEAVLMYVDPQPLSIIYITDNFIYSVFASILILLVNILLFFGVYQDRKSLSNS